MRLKDDYFNSPDQIYLETLPNGYLYSNILLKLYLLSLHDDGRLMFRDRIPYSVEMIATITRHTAETVREALETFKSLGLIEIIDTGAMYMHDIQNFIGHSSTEADRKREQRTRMEAEKKPAIADDKEPEAYKQYTVLEYLKLRIPDVDANGATKILRFRGTLSDAVIKAAIDEAWSYCDGKPQLNYVVAVLDRYNRDGVTNLEALRNDARAFGERNRNDL